MAELQDDRSLLETMMRGSERSDPIWQPSAYWRGYCARILRALDATGLANVRTNQAILKGFAAGGALQPFEPQDKWKRTAWRTLMRVPGVRKVVAEYERAIAAEHRHHVATRVRLARLLIERVSEDFPDLAPPAGLANGGAEDTFKWRGHTITADWLLFLVRAAGFYRTVPASTVGSLLEVGPGLGLSTLAHIALNPALKIVVNVDIPPVLYVSTQYLRSIDGVAVVDARDLADAETFKATPIGAGVTVYQIAPWQLSSLRGSLDVFHNAHSFQEMECEICHNYANAIGGLVRGHVWLLSRLGGHRPGAGGQREPVSLDFLTELFRGKFPVERRVDNTLLELFSDRREQVLLSRTESP